MGSIRIKWQTVNSELGTYDTCQRELSNAIASVWSVKSNRCMTGRYFTTIYRSLDKVISDMQDEKTDIMNLHRGLEDVLKMYDTYERRVEGQIKGETLKEVNVVSNNGNSSNLSAWIKEIFGNTVIDAAKIVSDLLPFISPTGSLLGLASGVFFGGSASADNSNMASASAGWLGYEFADDHPGVTAWIGKASAEAGNDWGYAGVNAYLGKVEAEAKTEASLMKYKKESEYKNGKWEDKEVLEFLYGEASAGVSVAALAGDAKASVGNDMLGAEVKAEGSVGNAKAEGKVKVSVGEDGVTAVAKGEAMVSAVEGKASGTINILGLEIKGSVGGYAGAVGVEGKIGIEDNKFVAEGSVAALLGFSAGVEIGFNSEGWSNFVDFITFWD